MALQKKAFPILEFDSDKNAILDPKTLISKIDISRYCVITFFRDVIEDLNQAGQLKQVSWIHSETLDIPVYETLCHGTRICLVLGLLGAAGAAAQLEELIAFGCEKFMVCGGAGVLQKDIAVGHIIVPYSAVRDEGVSYHYLAPSREVECNPGVVQVITGKLAASGIPYILAKTWTTDAFYRETKDKMALRVSEGCVSVEMEAAAFFAVSMFREITLGQILYGGDDLSGEKWDGRRWNDRKQIRANLVDLSMDICLEL